MDVLSRSKTLGEIVETVASTLGSPRSSPNEQVEPPPSPVRRMTLEAIAAPLAGDSGGLMPGGLVLVTDDGRGVAQALGESLRAEGHFVALLSPDRVDFSSPSAVEAALRSARDSGVIAGIVHALPLRRTPDSELDNHIWADRMRSEVSGLFVLAKAAAADLETAARNGGACLVSATAMGGALASTGADPSRFFPGHGAVAGLIKTLAREWPEVRAPRGRF